ncbi:MAG: hypothetical protein P8N09_06920 [Planctomycetota bacterium]|jgi:hypothetical protein|nr:hypothetical protein [Planctomycetota bacterium]
MNVSRFHAYLAFLVLAGACVAPPARPLPEEGTTPVPFHHMRPVDPTRVVQDLSDYKQERKGYHRERHRAPPGFDWKAAEAANAAAQRVKRNEMAGMIAASTATPWVERGSKNLAGRMHVAARSSDGSMLYGGSSRGGVWRGTLAGQDWTPLGDNLDGGAHWLAVVPGANGGDPDVMVRATDGGLIHRSTDDGQTWIEPSGLPDEINSVRRLLVTSDGSHSIFLLVRFWSGSQYNNRLYRSMDRGASFQQSIGLVDWEGDLWAPRTGGGSLYLLRNSNVWSSANNGDSWALVGTLPAVGSEGEISGSEAGAPRLWVVMNVSGTERLYRSDDAGVTWTEMVVVTDYWGTLNASSVNPDLVAWGGVEVHRSTDGGNTFDIVNPWWEYYGQEATKLHADIPGIDVVPDPGGGETWYICTDGGLYESTDGLASVSNLSLDGLRVSQYYTTHTSNLNTDHIHAGAQDQGYQSAHDSPVGGTLYEFDQLISGDYAHLTSGDGSHRWVYSVYPGFVLISKNENGELLYTEDFPPNESYPWLPYIQADPDANKAFFFCAKRLYRYEKAPTGNVWNPTQWSNFAFDGSSGEYMTGIAFSPLDSNRAYAATNHGRLFWSNDKGVTWNQSATTGPSEVWLYGTAIQPSHVDVDTVYVGGSGYGSPAVWKSTNGGQSFQAWGQGLPDTLVYCLAESPDGSTVMCGTQTSVFRRGASDPQWMDAAGNVAPITTYWSAEEVPGLNVIRFGTYGRGIWDYSLDDGCSYEVYGVGLGGTNTLALDTASPTTLAQLQTFDVSGGLPLTTGFLIVGIGAVSGPVFGGTILVDPANWILFGIGTDALGEVHKQLNVPNDPVLHDLTIYLQAALRDPGQAQGWVFSNGLTGTLCEP